MAKKNKTVTFQTKDGFEAELYKKASEEHNFSGLMKRLYANHLEQQRRQEAAPARQQTRQPQYIKDQGGIKLDLR